MNRGKKIVEGMVNFPITNSEWDNVGMGTSVFLVVRDDGAFQECCVPPIKILGTESLISRCESGMFQVRNGNIGELSTDLLFAMRIGTTGWAGWNEKGFWECTYNDLNNEAKQLLNKVSEIYDRKVEILTFLDT